MRERWYDIPGYEGAYQVSSRGRVRSLPRIDAAGSSRAGKLLSPICGPRHRPYRRYFSLFKKGKSAVYPVSALIARAYGLPNPQGHRFVIHRNGDFGDLSRRNLQWATLSEVRLHEGRARTPYYGVTLSGRSGTYRWVAQVTVDGRPRVWRLFATPEEAAYAHDQEVKRLGLDRPLNNIPKPEAYRHVEIASLPGEVWRPFPGADETHVISSIGRVRTLAYVTSTGNRVSPMLRKITVDRNGCHTILIRGKRYGIKKVIAEVFGDAAAERPPSTSGRSRVG